MRAWGLGGLRRAVRPRPMRAVLGILGVAISAVLVLVLLGAQRGLADGVRSYVGQERIDLWVAPRGTDNLIRSSAMLPLPLVGMLEKEPGVRQAAPVLRGFVAVAGPDAADPITLLALGYRGPDGMGGPPVVEDGRAPAAPREVVLDRAAAARLGAVVGDRVQVNEREFEVVGLSRGTNLFATQFLFLDGTEVERAAGMTGRVSFIALALEPGADPAAVAAALEDRFDTIHVWPRDAFVERNLREVLAGFRPFLLLITVVGTASATLVVALLVQAAVDERKRDLAVLLALGTPTWALGTAVLVEATLLLALGLSLGAALSLALQWGLATTVVTMELTPVAADLLVVVSLFGAAGLAAAVTPLLRLRRIDPVEAFRP